MKKEEKLLLHENWIKFKKRENKANKERVAIEKQLIELYPFTVTKDKKSKTFKDDDLGFKITITKGETIKLDQDGYSDARQNIPAKFRPEKITFSLVEKGYEWLKKNEPDIYKIVSKHVEKKPKKTAVKIEKI